VNTLSKIAAGALALGGVALAAPANAGVVVGIGVGVPGCGPFACGYPGYYYGPPRPYWRWGPRPWWRRPYWAYPYWAYPYPYWAYPAAPYYGYPHWRNPPPRPQPPSQVERSGCTTEVHGINFDFDKATIKSGSDAVLDQVLQIFRNDPNYSAEIGGHTDNVGSQSYNMALSRERAEAVKTWLVAHGVSPSRMTTAGYGFSKPLVPNTTAENRAQNRRVELTETGCSE